MCSESPPAPARVASLQGVSGSGTFGVRPGSALAACPARGRSSAMPIAYQDEPQAVPWLAKHDLAYYGPFRYAPTPLVVTSAGSNREKGSTLEKWRANRPAPPPPQGSFRPRAVRPRGTHRRGIAAPFLPFRLARPRTPPGWTAPPTWWAHRISGREIPLSHWRAFPGSGASSLPLFSPRLFLSRRSSPCPFISPVPTRPTRSSSFVPTLFPRDNVRAFVKNETEADDYYVEGASWGTRWFWARGRRTR